MANNFKNTFLHLVYQYFVQNFAIYVYKWYQLVVFLSCIAFVWPTGQIGSVLVIPAMLQYRCIINHSFSMAFTDSIYFLLGVWGLAGATTLGCGSVGQLDLHPDCRSVSSLFHMPTWGLRMKGSTYLQYGYLTLELGSSLSAEQKH